MVEVDLETTSPVVKRKRVQMKYDCIVFICAKCEKTFGCQLGEYNRKSCSNCTSECPTIDEYAIQLDKTSIFACCMGDVIEKRNKLLKKS